MADINPLEDSLKVSDVIKQSAIEHLDDHFEKAERLLLLWSQAFLLWNLIRCKDIWVFRLNMTQGATESIHILQA